MTIDSKKPNYLYLQDAVQTLINAVQELIQTHEATEKDEEKV